MKAITLIAIVVVIGTFFAVGIKTDLTGNVIQNFGGLFTSSAVQIDETIENTDEEIIEETENINDTIIPEVNTTTEPVKKKRTGGGGGGGSSTPAPNPEPDPNECSTDDDCGDWNPLTVDQCKDSIVGYDNETDTITYVKECVNIIPNFYGVVYDADKDNEGVEGINISFYDSETYDPYEDNGTGDYDSLSPKSLPDAVTDALGRYATFIDPDEIYHMVLQGSDEKAFNVRSRKDPTTDQKIITSNEGYIKVYFEKASAGLKSDLYIESPVTELLVENSGVGEVVYVNNSQVYPNGTELEFSILVHGTSWGLGEYKHYSNSKYAQVERLDSDTWRIHFEDLDQSKGVKPDWDFNDAVVLVDIVSNITNQTAYTDDCDEDGIVNWLDDDDSCDVGEEDQEIDEDNPEVEKFNAEGHLLFSGKYGEGHKYSCGDKLQFTMFGLNHGTEEENITFIVEDHIDGGNKGLWVYNASLDNENESLTVPADGSKYHKDFEFEVPCSFREGRHDIHVMWEGEKFHKIGNFFVVPDTKNPWINSQASAAGFPNETISIGYAASDPAEDGTIRALELMIAEANNETLTISVDPGYVGAENITVEGGGSSSIDLTYNESGEYNVTLTVFDASGKSASREVPVTVYITEDEADAIADPLYAAFGVNLDYQHDWVGTILGINTEWDRYDTIYEIGDEYLSPGNEITNAEAGVVNAVIDSCSAGVPYMKPINATTADIYNQTVFDFLKHLKCDCGVGLTGPAC